uniref:Uncharacterized protein n=1 Tax=Plectus sambesii TaxID=2011161 RepID=A0A914V140_9BILA
MRPITILAARRRARSEISSVRARFSPAEPTRSRQKASLRRRPLPLTAAGGGGVRPPATGPKALPPPPQYSRKHTPQQCGDECNPRERGFYGWTIRHTVGPLSFSRHFWIILSKGEEDGADFRPPSAAICRLGQGLQLAVRSCANDAAD